MEPENVTGMLQELERSVTGVLRERDEARQEAANLRCQTRELIRQLADVEQELDLRGAPTHSSTGADLSLAWRIRNWWYLSGFRDYQIAQGQPTSYVRVGEELVAKPR